MSAASFRRIWGMPLLLAVLIVFGLLAALLGTGWWHLVAWAALGAPLLILMRFVRRSRRTRGAGSRDDF